MNALLHTGPAFVALVQSTDEGLARALEHATSAAAVEAMLPEGIPFVIAQWVGPVVHARASGGALALLIHRGDGSTLTLTPPDEAATTEIIEPHCRAFALLEGSVVRFEHPAGAPTPEFDDTTLISQRSRAAALLELVDGVRIGVDRELLVGRSPRVRRATAALPGVLALENERVSRTHARIAVDGTAVTLEDLGSANGTRVQTSAGEQWSLVAGEPIALTTGMTVSIADRLAFRVVRVP